MSDLATQNNTTPKRPREMLNPDHENQQTNENSKKRPKVKRNNSTTSSVDLCQRLSKAIENILIITKNDEFRWDCFRQLDVENSSDAGAKIKELAEQLKGKKQHKGDKKSVSLKRKINENPKRNRRTRTYVKIS